MDKLQGGYEVARLPTKNDDDHLWDFNFALNELEVFEAEGVNLMKESFLYNSLHSSNLTVSATTTLPY